MNSLLKSFVFISSLAVATHYLYKNFRNKRKLIKKTRKEVHEVIMFSNDDTLNDKKQFLSESTNRLIQYLNSARSTVDICMYLITNKDIYHVLSKLLYRGVKIRFITDADMAFSSGSQIKKLSNRGVSVRWRKSCNIMHHKFCLIDSQIEDENVTPLLIAGSLNWTTQALYGNWEDVIVTSQEKLINEYKIEFEKMWHYCKPIV